MLYEFLYGPVPFGDGEFDPYIIYEIVQQCKLNFPPNSENKDKVKDLLAQLLNKNPAVRLGGSFENLKSHTWFIGINWEKILRRELPTPYIPILRSTKNDISIALKLRKPLDEIISKVEKNDVLPKPRRVQSRVPENWDDEFNS